MGIGEAVSKGFEVAKKSMGLILVLFIVGAVFNVLNVFVAPPPPAAGAEPTPPSPAAIAIGVISLLVTIFMQAGSMAYVRDRLKTGAAALSNFTSGGGKYYVKLLLLGLMVFAIAGGFIFLAAVLVGILNAISPFLGVPVGILFAALALYFIIMWSLSPYALIADDKSVMASLKTSMRLVKKNIGKLIGIGLVVILIGFGVGLLLGALLAGINLLVKAAMPTQIAFAVLSSLVNAFLGILVTAAFMNFYLSLPDRNA